MASELLPCKHPEARSWGFDENDRVHLRIIPGHDCGYVDFRNKQIPNAEAMVLSHVSQTDPRFSRLFMAAMDELCSSVPFPKGVL